ncbi:hypothetical protein AArcCO_1490 [Halalkaliarchaeum sp. AArc-CO]|nr:hypothetical protein AArcCO_1490 [Halalkaliarchaeum sp. AArc-CO]
MLKVITIQRRRHVETRSHWPSDTHAGFDGRNRRWGRLYRTGFERKRHALAPRRTHLEQ